MICPRCGSKTVRFSRMRASDLVRLLVLQRPVRCHICLHRRFANIFTAWAAREKRNGGPEGASAGK